MYVRARARLASADSLRERHGGKRLDDSAPPSLTSPAGDFRLTHVSKPRRCCHLASIQGNVRHLAIGGFNCRENYLNVWFINLDGIFPSRMTFTGQSEAEIRGETFFFLNVLPEGLWLRHTQMCKQSIRKQRGQSQPASRQNQPMLLFNPLHIKTFFSVFLYPFYTQSRMLYSAIQ